KAATRFFRKLLTGLEYVPRVLVTDKLASYGVAHQQLMPGVEHGLSVRLVPGSTYGGVAAGQLVTRGTGR
ncbi:MAG: hypothetical protein WCF33_15870, partial [Pseudonocardiaceae bacterium]